MKIKHSLFSNKSSITEILDLGLNPPSDTFIKKNNLDHPQYIMPLVCNMCKKTGGIQLAYVFKEDIRYNLNSYSYSSGNSNFSRNYWKSYCHDILKKYDLKKNDNFLEIGSNDGFLCSQFKKNGYKIYGVDPSKAMTIIAKKRKIKTFNFLFNFKNSVKIKNAKGKFKLLIANNVFNHSNNPRDFLKGIKNLIRKDGLFIYEAPYWLTTIKSGKFDQIYHEHVTYLNVKSSYNLLKDFNLEIIDIVETNYHGGSIRFYTRFSSNPKMNIKVRNYIQKETKFGLYNKETYKDFSQKLLKKKYNLLNKIIQLKIKGYKIICVGAAAKGNTFLNFHGLNKNMIDYITDTSKLKIGKYSPLSNIKIVNDEIFKKYEKVYALILSWNIQTILEKKIKKINNKVKFLYYD